MIKQLTAIVALALSCFAAGALKAAGAGEASSAVSAYNYDFVAIDGTPLPLGKYRGRVLLIVNVASRCGFVGQYAGLERLYETYKDHGLVVIGVPSNDFGAQEPGSAAEIAAFASDTYQATFPLTQKLIVSGTGADPFYRWAATQNVGGILGTVPRWNFHKYLIGRDGQLRGSYTAMTKPENLQQDIESALAE